MFGKKMISNLNHQVEARQKSINVLHSRIDEYRVSLDEAKARIKMLEATDDYKKKLIDNLLLKIGIDPVAPGAEPGEVKGEALEVLTEEQEKLEKKFQKGDVADFGDD